MLKLYALMSVLFVLSHPLLCEIQAAEKTESNPVEAPVDAAAPMPELPGDILFESAAGNVLFPHGLHERFGCKRCHHQIHAMELDTPHPDYLESSRINCQECHDATSQTTNEYYKCAHCHLSDLESTADETLSTKVVTHQSCWKCHKTGTGVKASKECGECHAKEEK